MTDTNPKKITIQSDFKYYQNNDFHKLAQETDSKNGLSIKYTNMCFLCAKLEDLELFIANLDHTFDIIGVSETWTLETNQNNQNIKMIPGYQPY